MNKLKILSWNVEHFNGKGGISKSNKKARLNRVDNVVNYIKDKKPDIFALSEVEGSMVYNKMTDILPGYVFNITEGDQSQEILVGVKHGITSFFTQRNEYKRNNPRLRPGALLTVKVNDENISILFTHLKSMPSPEGFGLRDAMFAKTFNLKKALDKASKKAGKGDCKFMVLGDMNTMGMNYEGKEKDISSQFEINTVARRYTRRGMYHLQKNYPYTFNNGSKSSYKPSDLDHVFATKNMEFESVNGGGVVHVGGWAELAKPKEQDKWINKYSDHAPLSLTLKL